MSNIININLKCEKATCSNMAKKALFFQSKNDGKINDYHVLICEKCAEKLIMQGYAYRKLTEFKLIEYISLENYFQLADLEPDDDDI